MPDNLILKKADIEGMEERSIVHPFNEKAVINMKTVGDEAGLTTLGVHIMRFAPGDETTASHNHEVSDEFVYVLSGYATLYTDGREYELGPGDFAGFPANGPAHHMKNTGGEDLVFLVSGSRPPADAIHYPHAGKKMYKVGGRMEVVDTAGIGVLKPPR